MKSKFMFALMLLMVSATSLQAFRLRTIGTDPAAAVDGDDVTIVISGDFPITGCRLAEANFTVNHDTLHAELVGIEVGIACCLETPFTSEYRWGELPAGDYVIHVQLLWDYQDHIELIDDTLATIRVEESLDCYPNLAVSEAWMNRDVFYFPVSEVYINYVISNIGEHYPAGVSQERIYFTSTKEGFCPDDYHYCPGIVTGIDSLYPGESVEKNDVCVETISRLIAGEHFVIVQADGDQNVVESNENDNWRAIPFTVVDTIDHHHTFVERIETTHPASYLKIHENMLYVINYIYGDTCGFGIFDVSNPERPVELAHIHFGEHLSAVKIQGNIAYVLDLCRGVYLINIEQPELPEILSYIKLEGICCFALRGDYLYAGGNNPGLSVYNLSNASDPELLLHTNTEYQISYLLVKDDNLIAWSRQCQCVYSINLPQYPVIQDCFQTEYSVTFATLSGNTGYLLTSGTMRIVDFTRLYRPVELSRYHIDRWVKNIAVDGNFAYIPNFSDGLLTLNVADIENVQRSGEFYDVERTECVDFNDEYVFLANNYGGIVIVRNDLHPSEVDEETEEVFATSFSLSSPYTNPYNSTTTIGYSLPTAGMVSLAVYDLSGCEVARLVDGAQSAGTHEAVWTAEGVSAGVYFVRLETNNSQFLQKVLLLK